MSCTWLTTKETAEYLHVSYHTVRSWMLNGTLPSVSPTPRFRRVCLEELQAWMGKGVPAEPKPKVKYEYKAERI